MTLGEKIYELRNQHNLSQGDLANELNISRQSISKWENNNSTPDLEKIVKLAEIFNVSLNELIKDEEQKTPEIDTSVQNTHTENSLSENELDKSKSKKIKLTTVLKIIDIVGFIALILCFFYRFTLVISDESNVFWFDSGKFTTYSFFDGVIKINLIFAICLFIILLILKIKKIDKVSKSIKTTLSVLLVLFMITNVIHLALYDLKYYTKWNWSGTNDENFEPVSAEYDKYFPYFDKMDEFTDFDVGYNQTTCSTPIGNYLYMQTWCYDLGINFYYEEIHTKSQLFMTQFIMTKGKPNWDNENGETVYMESVQNKEYNCSVYSHEDFYEIWFVEKNNCVIIRYEKFGEFFNMTEEDILKDARHLYDLLKMG